MEKEYLIQKWLNDELTSEELEAFTSLDDYQFYVDIVENATEFKASDVSKVDDFEIFKSRLIPKTSNETQPLWANPFLRIASVLVIALGLYFTVFYNPMTKVNSLAQQKITIELPDESLVTLNAMSEVEFNEKHWFKKREITLKGEAFFKVQKGKTFDVITSDGIVTVVGTEFSVKQREGYFEVICFEGVVEVKYNSTSETLTAGKTYRKINGSVSQGTTSLIAPQWIHNISSFDVVPISEVIAEMERQYDLKIDMQTIEQNRLFTGGFVHDNLENALISITQPLNLTYKIESPKQVVIYGQKK